MYILSFCVLFTFILSLSSSITRCWIPSAQSINQRGDTLEDTLALSALTGKLWCCAAPSMCCICCGPGGARWTWTILKTHETGHVTAHGKDCWPVLFCVFMLLTRWMYMFKVTVPLALKYLCLTQMTALIPLLAFLEVTSRSHILFTLAQLLHKSGTLQWL